MRVKGWGVGPFVVGATVIVLPAVLYNVTVSQRAT